MLTTPRPAASYAWLVRLPSGSIVAMDWSAASYSVEVRAPTGLMFATALTYKVMELNPEAETLVPGQQTINIDVGGNTI